MYLVLNGMTWTHQSDERDVPIGLMHILVYTKSDFSFSQLVEPHRPAGMADGGGPKSKKWKDIIEQNRAGVGRTEVAFRRDCIVFCALPFGHGPRNPAFQGFCKR